ncbi:MAG TPA: DsbA family oxidoreductase [Pseudogracilibacillus sp.]|nr:DsbA family oxidoreductase [Pseudogracilibacillus sp.]
MKIEIWSDFACPFCYIGKKTFEEALNKSPNKEKFTVEFKSFQLDPSTPPYSGQNYYESMAKKFGGIERTKEMMAGVANKAKESGLTFNFETMKPTNTLAAHRLMKLASKHNKASTLVEKIFQAHFTDSKDIGNIETLTQLAKASGLNKQDVITTLEDTSAFASDVTFDINEASQLGITSVPSFIFNRKYLVSGAQPEAAFTQALNKLVEEHSSTPFESINSNDKNNSRCETDRC